VFLENAAAAFFLSFREWVRGFHHLLWENPSYEHSTFPQNVVTYKAHYEV